MRKRAQFAAVRAARVARPAAVAEQVHVELQLLPARGDREHLVVHLLERRLLAEQAEAPADARDVRVDRDLALPVGEQEHAGGGLAADAGQREQEARGRPRCGPSSGSRASARRIAWMRCDLTFEMPPGRIASSTSSSGASRTASQLPKRRRSRRNATSRLRSLVDWESTVRISSSSPVPCGGAAGIP